jgi:hypothetical protein
MSGSAEPQIPIGHSHQRYPQRRRLRRGMSSGSDAVCYYSARWTS